MIGLKKALISEDSDFETKFLDDSSMIDHIEETIFVFDQFLCELVNTL